MEPIEKQQTTLDHGDDDQVVLFGTWASPPTNRVRLALQLKAIPYKYIEEDLDNKSQLLLTYNPVHKKVPVLVHNGKPIAESLVILEYIDEYWSSENSPKLLPEDPYHRAKARFWANFYDQKVVASTYKVMFARGKVKELEDAVKEFDESLTVFEEGVQKDFPTMFYSNNGGILGLLEIVVGTYACIYAAFDEAVTEMVDKAKHSAYVSWADGLKENALMKERLPPHEKLVAKIISMTTGPA